ncbi:aromatic amino acid hydroxylase, partial [bacterium]|nr:aromatic amino acid hydroxylase [bacterium]
MFTTTSTTKTPSFKEEQRMKTFKQIIEQIPSHLRQYVVEQDYSRYTPVEQATWRFILRQLKNFLTKNAHECYVEGLTKTGIDTETIPRIEVMCEKLQEFGWSAIPVSGFIPPAAFMELQSLSILPIACDMRSIDHILYTPAPDIVHEAAGHAPILVDPQFANYLKEYAQVAKKAIISSEDLSQYEAIRDLSDIKENPASTPAQIQQAEKHLQKVNASITHVSEAALLGRMNWWTAEYGLIGDLQKPKIFGAGILSSIGESRHCLQDNVKKIPLTVDCIKTSYDITEEQPQLFVAKTFSDLSKVLRDLEAQLSFRRGGLHGLQTAIKAKTVNTVELDSGLQISGVVTEVLTDSQNNPIYFKFTGPTQLCENSKQLPGHDVHYHQHGFSSPLGALKKTPALRIGESLNLEFVSGVTVNGKLKSLLHSKENKLMIASFENCTVKHQQQTLFQPDWGTFDMAVGTTVTSVFAGPADRINYGSTETFVKKVIPPKVYSTQRRLKHDLYQKIREVRESKKYIANEIESLFNEVQQQFPDQWLACLELLELSMAA